MTNIFYLKESLGSTSALDIKLGCMRPLNQNVCDIPLLKACVFTFLCVFFFFFFKVFVRSLDWIFLCFGVSVYRC